MAFLRRRPKPISSRADGKSGRGCTGLFLLVWGLGFLAGGVTMLSGALESGTTRWLIGIPFTLLGGGAVGFGLLLVSGRIGRGDAARPLVAPSGLIGPVQRGPRTLHGRARRGCRVGCLVPFTAIWLSALVFVCSKAADEGGFLWIVAGVLGAAGVALVLVCVHQVLALTNPRPELDIEVDEIAIGAPVELTWRLVGSTSRVGPLTIELIGREHAWYQRGTTRHLDREDFLVQTLHAGTVAGIAAGGTLRFPMPKCAVPSFKSRSNEILWMIRFKGPIRFWPDVFDEIDLPIGAMALGPGRNDG